MIEAIRNWHHKNLSTLSYVFGITGVILLLYFGVFSIPHHLKETTTEKMNNAQRDVEQSVKELIFSDTAANFMEIKFLIEAKEIRLNKAFPLSIPEVLTLAQQSFMEDRFLPLKKRKELVKELEDLKASVPKALEQSPKKRNQSFWTPTRIGTLLSIIVSIAIALSGAYTLMLSYKKERRE